MRHGYPGSRPSAAPRLAPQAPRQTTQTVERTFRPAGRECESAWPFLHGVVHAVVEDKWAEQPRRATRFLRRQPGREPQPAASESHRRRPFAPPGMDGRAASDFVSLKTAGI